jgi:hypothetical protein
MFEQIGLFDPPPINPAFELGDRVCCPDGVGSVYNINAFVWVAIGNVAKPYEHCDVTLCEHRPLPVSNPRSQWHSEQAAFYLRLMGRFLRPDAVCSQAVRSHEIERLHRLRQEALAKIGGV